MATLSYRLAAVLGAAAAGCALACAATQAPPRTRALYPVPRGVYASTALVMASAPREVKVVTATLDGKTVPLRRMEFSPAWTLPGRLKSVTAAVGDRSTQAVWVGAVRVPAGERTVAVAGRTTAIRGGAGAVPNGWTRVHAHPPVPGAAAPGCGGCHVMADGALGAAPTPTACAPCHDETAVQLVHKHVAPPLARCATCHDPHGATRPYLLVDAREKLCARCHELGHSKG